jgi:DNA sulfur modification protein DndD
MILDALTLQDFGVYGGQQEMVLTPEDEGRPIILVGGLNGGGKTTFLDAIQLAFYGTKARISNRGKLKYSDYLQGAIHRGADPAEGAAITLHFRRTVDGCMHSYRLRRSWRVGPKGVEENIDVQTDGEPDPLLSEHWDEYIESYIPSGISHLFFFDAEQIKDLAEGQHAAELLGTAIHSLLGLDLVDRLETDLLALERRKKAAVQPAEETGKLKVLEQEVERLDRLLEGEKQTLSQLQGELDQLGKGVRDCEGRFKREGGELYLKRADMENDRKKLEDAVAAEEHQLRELAAGAAPMLLILPLLEKTETQARSEVESGRARLVAETLETRDAEILEKLGESKIPAAHLATLTRLLDADRRQRLHTMETPVLLGADDHLAQELRHLRTAVLPETARRIQTHLQEVSRLREHLSRADSALARVPEADAIATLQRELETARHKQREKEALVKAEEAKLGVLARQLEEAEKARERAHGQSAEEQIGQDDVRRLLKHSAKVRQTMKAFRTRIIRKHTERIGALMLDSFTQLLRKRSLVSRLQIDPETYQIELTGGDGRPLPFDRLSAGEKQLLATSLLWGLARASGRPLPTIIDTPLGRLDSTHRKHLIERYFPVASHQVILLSTDEEIDEDSMRRLQPHIGRSYSLDFNESLRQTRIQPGYFWNHETTR